MCTNKLRTALTGFSVAWGIFMLILLLSISNGLVNMMEADSSKRDINVISVYGGSTSLPYKGYKEGRDIRLKGKYADGIKTPSNPEITSVDSKMSFSGQISTSKDYLSSGSMQGVFPSAFDGKYNFIYGRPINQADINGSRKSLVLSDKSAAILFEDSTKAVGKVVKVGSLGFVVVGIYKHEWDTDSYLPYTTALALNGFDDNVWRMDVHFKDVNTTDESSRIEKQVREAIATQANFDASDPSAVYTSDRFANYEEQKIAGNIMYVAMWVIGVLTLITGIVGVSNIMFVSVRERTHEIGIRRAIGAKPRNILTQVLTESVAITTLFGYVGVFFGILATAGIGALLGDTPAVKNPGVDIAIAVEVTVVLVIAGALAGLFPALKALKVKPVEALATE